MKIDDIKRAWITRRHVMEQKVVGLGSFDPETGEREVTAILRSTKVCPGPADCISVTARLSTGTTRIFQSVRAGRDDDALRLQAMTQFLKRRCGFQLHLEVVKPPKPKKNKVAAEDSNG